MKTTPEPSSLALWRKITYSMGQMGTALVNMTTISWLLYYYTGRVDAQGEKIMLVSYSAFALISIISRIIDALSAPVIGYASDRIITPWGRRKPWIVIAAPLLILSAVLLFYPPGPAGSLSNVIWLGIIITGLWLFYTAIIAPYTSLLPEISPHIRERIEISSYMGVFEVMGTLSATIAVGLVIKYFPHGFSLGPVSITDGYKLALIMFGIIALAFLWISVMFIHEKPHSQAKEIPYTLKESVANCLKNHAFIRFSVTLMLFITSINSLILMIPFMVTLLMGYEPHVGGYIQGGLVASSLLMFPLVFRLSSRFGKKKVFSISLLMFASALPIISTMDQAPFIGTAVNMVLNNFHMGTLDHHAVVLVHGIVPMVLFVFPLASFFVLIRPIFADLIDLDEKYTGYRREAMYDGLMGLILKVGAGTSTIIAPMALKFFGDTPEDPGGIQAVFLICTGILLVAHRVFRKYPINH